MPSTSATRTMLLRTQPASNSTSLRNLLAATATATTTTIAPICSHCRHSIHQRRSHHILSSLRKRRQPQPQARPHADHHALLLSRGFTTTTPQASGHNRWSKIRHEKGAADAKKTAQRNIFAKHLTLYSKLYGSDPNINSQLASVIAAAKKAGMPKANIDVAVERGQGRSTSGASLETATLELIVTSPDSSVSLIVDIESDNKTRSIKDLRAIAKKLNANAAPTAFQFTRTGRTVLGVPSSSGSSKRRNQEAADKQAGSDERFDEVLMAAVDAGAEDVEQDEEDGSFVLWTQPGSTHLVAQTVSKQLDLEILSSDIIYKPTGEAVEVNDEEAAQALATVLAGIKEYPDVSAIYANAVKGDAVSDETWDKIEDCLDV